MKKIRKYGPFVMILIVLIAVGIVLFYYSPEALIEQVGVKNSYVILFFLALFGGASTFTSSSFYASIGIFAAGGLEPIMIALVASPALVAGDSLYYYLGSEARIAFLQKYEKRIMPLNRWLQKHKVMIPVFVYIYTGLTPFPGDLLMLFLAVIKYPLRKAIIPVFLGHASLIFMIAFFSKMGLQFFFGH